MLRDKNLVPLSRQHQHALALCVQIDRALRKSQVNLAAWQQEIAAVFEQEIRIHFEAEDRIVFPAAARFPELRTLVDELQNEHATLRALFTHAPQLARDDLQRFTSLLSVHIRKEERRLFEGLQEKLGIAEMEQLGSALEAALQSIPSSCSLKPKGEF